MKPLSLREIVILVLAAVMLSGLVYQTITHWTLRANLDNATDALAEKSTQLGQCQQSNAEFVVLVGRQNAAVAALAHERARIAQNAERAASDARRANQRASEAATAILNRQPAGDTCEAANQLISEVVR